MILLLVLCLVLYVNCETEVCDTLNAYIYRSTDKCWTNKDVDLTVPYVILSHGYPVKDYLVKTKDGYILHMFRIPYGRNGQKKSSGSMQPVFLQHGVFASSAAYVIVGNQSIAFNLADEGFDVWLGNSRGSYYSKGHTQLSTKDAKYWDFSFHEMGMYDSPAFLDIISKETGRKDIIYIGQSMGTNIPYVYSSMKPDHAAQRLKLIVALAPTVFLGDIQTVLRISTPFMNHMKVVTDFLGIHEIFAQSKKMKAMSNWGCFTSECSLKLCIKMMFAAFGPNYNEFAPENLPLLLSHYPAGSSVKTLVHLGQGVNTNQFCQYDYGEQVNMKKYNSPTPPVYDLSKVKVPSFIMYGTNDYLATESGAKLLYSKLPKKAGIYKLDGFNHIDFFFAKHVHSLLIKALLEELNKHKKNK